MKKQVLNFWFIRFIFGFSFLLFLTQPVVSHESFSGLVKSERDKIVHLSVSSVVKNRSKEVDPFFERFFPDIPRQRKESALGSGFIISEDGYIVTNNHVVEKADKIEVRLLNEEIYSAQLIGRDSRTDLALLKVEAKGLPFVKLGDSSMVEIGDWVIAIGNPLGLDYSVTAGILSARGREIFGGTAYGQFLQTDAAINPGNSGGPLFNEKGEVIGINTAIIAGGQGLGFSIPMNLARKVIEQLKKFGKVKRGWFGVGIQTITGELAESFGLPDGMRGVAITAVGDNSPAAKAGIVVGDIIVNFEGKPLRKTTELQQKVAETFPGETIEVEIFRNGEFLKMSVTVDLAPSEDTAVLKPSTNRFGVRLVEINPETQKQYRVKEEKGLVVVEIDVEGVAYEAGLRKGDVITKANQRNIETVGGFNEAIEEAGKKTSSRIALLVWRDGRAIFIALPLEKK